MQSRKSFANTSPARFHFLGAKYGKKNSISNKHQHCLQSTLKDILCKGGRPKRRVKIYKRHLKSEVAVVSIIIPVFNRGSLLIRALTSIEKQKFRDYEVIVVDDHSTEDHIPALSDTILLLKTAGKGVSAARNTGIAAARGNLIAFLDSDDEWLPVKLEKQIEFLKKNPEFSVVHTNEIWQRNGVEIKQSVQQKKSGGRIFAELTERCLIAASNVLIRKEVFEKIGLFDETFPVCEDFDLWLRIASQFDIGFLTEALSVKHAGHEGQLSTQFHSMDLWRVRALAKHLNSPTLSDAEINALHANLLKKAKILQKGFTKHKNWQYSDEIENYINSISY